MVFCVPPVIVSSFTFFFLFFFFFLIMFDRRYCETLDNDDATSKDMASER